MNEALVSCMKLLAAPPVNVLSFAVAGEVGNYRLPLCLFGYDPDGCSVTCTALYNYWTFIALFRKQGLFMNVAYW